MNRCSAWLLGCLILVLQTASAATYTVINTNDASAGSLRQAILDANANPGKDAIEFDIPGVGLQTIAPLTPLPTIADPITLDGYTQPGAAVNTLSNGNNAVLRVELSGVNLTAPARGLWIAATNCVMRGLVINRFTNDAVGILVEGFDGSVIEGSFIGTDATGTNVFGNSTGILLSDSTGNRIGGTAPASRNVIGGNLYGISLNVTVGNEILGNYVGLGADGLTVVSNLSGIFLHNSTQAQVGGSTPGARNVISGNDNGFVLNGGGSNIVQGNFVGTDATGILPRGNTAGISLNESSYNLVGGSSAGEGNLVSGNFRSGLTINGLDAKSNVVSGNLIGTDFTGKAALGNGDYGVFIGGASGNLVGGADSDAGNVISGNGRQGISIYHYGGATGNVIQGNFIGTDSTGTNGLGNEMGGIWMAAPGNFLGGTNVAAGNVISGNTGYGVIMVDGGSNNVVQGNIVGLDASGLRELGNSVGVSVQDTSGNLIGGAQPGARNVISGNTNGAAYNVIISGPATDNRLEGNFIGPDALGNGPISNGYGIWIGEAYRNTVGGLAPGAGNLIAYNYAGVVLQFSGTTNNAILGNSIYANDLLGIDLAADGATDNDVQDADAGPNQLQNFPVIVSAISAGGTTVQGSFVGAPNRNYRLEFFSSDLPLEPSEHGEGRNFLGSTNVATDGTGGETFVFHTASAVTLDQLITATATDPDGNTSEFSRAAQVTGSPAVSSISVTTGLLGSSVVIVGTNFSSVASNNVVWFGGVRAQVVSASSAELVVNVPPGASYAPVSVTVGGLTASSRLPFGVTFPSTGGIDSNLFASPVHFRVGAVDGVGHLVDTFATGDLDDDGRSDFLFSTRPSPLGTFALQLFTNAASPGVFTTNSLPAPMLVDQGVGRMTVVAVKDIDGDGRLDVVTRVGFDAGNSRTDVYRNVSTLGAPAFTRVEVYPTNLATLTVTAVGDLDGDGRIDLLGVNTNRVYHAMRNISVPGEVAFAAPVPIIVACCSLNEAPQVADLDGDGRAEIIWVDPGGERRVAIFRNLSTPGSLGTNSFAPFVRLPLREGRNQLAIADVDVDGKLDLVVTAGCTNVARVFRNVSIPGTINSNSFSAPVDFNVGGAPLFLAVADFDGDGRPDLVTGNCATNDATCGATCGSNTLSVLRNVSASGAIDGSSFSAPVIFPAGDGGARPKVGDFDNDGRPDLLVATYISYFSIWRNALEPVCALAPAGIIGWWPGNGSPNDVVGGHDGTTIGTVQYPPGRVGQAFNFDGDGFDYVEMPAVPALSPHAGSSGEMTLEAWILIRSLPMNEIVRVVHKVEASLGWEYELMMDRAGRAHFAMSSPNAAYGYTATGGRLSSFQWHHVAGTYRAGQFIRLYVDGALVHEILNPNLVTSATPAPFAIGGSPYFNGMLDEVTLYNRALSGNEVAALAASGAAGKCPPAPLTIGVLGGGGVARSPNKALYSYGESVALMATNRPHYTFLRWSDGVTTASRLITAGSVNNIVAVFTNTVPLEELVFPVWQQSYGGTGDDQVREIQPLADGGFLVSGDSVSLPGGTKTAPSRGMSDIWLLRVDGTGQVLWDQTYGGSGDEYQTMLRQTSTNRWMLDGISASPPGPDKTSLAYGGFDVWRVELDDEGMKLNESSFGGASDDSGVFLPLPDGGGFLAGHSASSVGGTKTSTNFGSFDFWLVRLSANGSVLWDTAAGGGSYEVFGGAAVVPLPDNGTILAGYTGSGISGNKTSPAFGNDDAWVARFGLDGEKLWDRSFGGDEQDVTYDLATMPDGGFVLVGQTYSGVSGNKTSAALGDSDAWLLRLDASGNKLWDLAFGGTGYDYASRVTVTSDGGLLISGASDSPISGNKTVDAIGSTDVWLVRLDPYGNKLWEQVLGGTDEEYSGVMVMLADGFITGNVSASPLSGNKTSPHHGGYDYWLARFATREAPIGTPAILVNGQFSPTNFFFVTNLAMVSIQTTFPDGHIVYTLNGAPPGTGPTYSGPFAVNQSVTVRAIAYNADYSESAESDPVTITVVSSPTVTLPPASQTAVQGGDVILFGEAGGSPPLDYAWLFGGEPIVGANNSFLQLLSISPAQAGDYQLIVGNLFGAITSAVATVTVLAAPAITAQPVSTNISIGESATFCVSASGSPPLTYQWRLNGVNIPDATNECYTATVSFAPFVGLTGGGSYTVVVQNEVEAVTSDAAVLGINVPAPISADNFAQRSLFDGNALRGTNTFATKETGEPDHAGNAGGRSIWYEWTPTDSANYRLRTAGSSFDTLLAVYTGTNVANLSLVAEDDDSGGFHTSSAQFYANAGQTYLIAVDGFAGAEGEFVLSLVVLQGTIRGAEIVQQPVGGTVEAGVDFTVSVIATNASSYEWNLNGVLLPGASGASLTITNVQAEDVGSYHVVVRGDPSTAPVSSVPAVLEIGPFATLRSVDRVEELLTPFGSLRAFQPASGGSSVTIGSLGTQLLNTTNSTTSFRETNHCGIIGGASRWFKLKAATNATFVLDTEGSVFDTVLAVYISDVLLSGYPTKFIGCNDDASAAVRWSRVAFSASNGVEYVIAVDGVGGASGPATLNWWLGNPPTPGSTTPPVLTPIVREGTNLTLVTTSTNGVPPPRLQWYRNQTLLENATNALLSIGSVQRANAGTYSVVAMNPIGSITTIVARVTVDVPLFIGLEPVTENGRTHFRVTGAASERFLLQGTTNFLNWIPIYTNQPLASPLDFQDYSATNRVRRFYRALPWP